MRLLVVHGDAALAAGLRCTLQREGFAVDTGTSGTTADRLLQDTEFDLVVLDLDAPGIAPLDVLRRMRARGHRAPVLVLSRGHAEAERVAALDRGADDCIGKPFSIDEFNARVRALLRRENRFRTTETVYGRLTFDAASRTATVDGVLTALSNREASVLEALLQGFGRLVTKERLMNQVYGLDGDVGPNTIEVYIHRLRKKLVGSALSLRTVHRRGYLLELEMASELETAAGKG